MGKSSFLALAAGVAWVFGASGAAAFQTDQQRSAANRDAQLRSEIRQHMRYRSLQQRLNNEAGSQRTEQTADRVSRDARRARERALGR